MKCRKVAQKWQSYLDGEVLPGEQQQILDHIRHCEECEKRFGAIASLIGALHHIPVASPPKFSFPVLPKRRMPALHHAAALLLVVGLLIIGLWAMRSPISKKQSNPVIETSLPKVAKTEEKVKRAPDGVFEIIEIKEQTVYRRSGRDFSCTLVSTYSYRGGFEHE